MHRSSAPVLAGLPRLGACLKWPRKAALGVAVLDFCFNGEFPDHGGAICLPTGSNFTSGAAIMRQAPVFGNCTGVAASAECAAARDVIFGGLNCPFCSEVAELVAPAQGQCAAIRSEQQCTEAPVVMDAAAVSANRGPHTGAHRVLQLTQHMETSGEGHWEEGGEGVGGTTSYSIGVMIHHRYLREMHKHVQAGNAICLLPRNTAPQACSAP